MQLFTPLTQSCTTLVAVSRDGKAAFVSHSNDGGSNTDPRVFRAPSNLNPSRNPRPIFPALESYPRYVGTARGPMNYPSVLGHPPTKPIGTIAATNRSTFSLLEATYGIANEAGVIMAESTCSARFDAKPVPQGKALLSIDELSRIALERASSAREAVEIMGVLSERHGFYGEGFEGVGESLLVADVKGDAWIFHILPDDKGASAIWAAQRVPRGHVAVVANAYVIREIDFSDSVNFLYSPNIRSIALRLKLWSPGESFDFTKIYSGGEYGHKYYSGRRVWRGLSMLAPSAASGLKPEYSNYQ